MQFIKHSKIKNTGLIFEILTRQITSDLLEGKASPAANIIKKYFVKTELSKEYKLYELLTSWERKTSTEFILTQILESSKKINRVKLSQEKYNLIKEIKEFYNTSDLFKTQVKNYKPYAALYTLIECYNSEKFINPKQIIDNKVTIIESLEGFADRKVIKENVLTEFATYDKDLRLLTYKILLEKFNEKYSNFCTDQKRVLREFINSVDNTPKLKSFYKKELSVIKDELSSINSSTKNQVTQIKINELVRLVDINVSNIKSVREDELVNLLQLHELKNQLTHVNG